jgi:putative membrane protein
MRLSTSLDHARTGRSVPWLSLLGLVLVPLAIAGLLVWSLYDPQARLNTVTAAIVNEDVPVEVNGQLAPLGRQLTAGLVGADDTNFDWVITDSTDAEEGLADGRYTAVVTIPEDFSANATSFTGDPDDARSASIEVVSGDHAKLVDGAVSQAIATAAVGIFNEQLTVNYIEGLLGGFDDLSSGIGTAADGAAQLADGTRQYTSGVVSLSGGLATIASETAAIPGQVGQLGSGAGQLAGGAGQLAGGITAVDGELAKLQSGTGDLQQLAQQMQAVCAADGTGAECAQLQAMVVGGIGALPGGIEQLRVQGLQPLIGGATGLQSGASQLESGIGQLQTGLGQLSAGITQTSNGAAQLAAGGPALQDGADQLASGLDEAAAAIPTSSTQEAAAVAEVAARPVVLDAPGGIFSDSAAPLAAGLALWLGALATFLVLRPMPRDAVGSTLSPVRQALRSALPAFGVGAVQGIGVAAILQIQLGLDLGGWSALAAACVLVAVVFAAVNQALVALASGVGRFISMLVATLFLATGVISTVPAALAAVAGVLPVSPAGHLLAAVQAGGMSASSLVVLLVWGALSFIATTIAIARVRVAAPAALLRPRPALVS